VQQHIRNLVSGVLGVIGFVLVGGVGSSQSIGVIRKTVVAEIRQKRLGNLVGMAPGIFATCPRMEKVQALALKLL
jgi:hypothetical protein